ncbi:hypothetical protein JTE90_013785 [Oedothorax gibbosus]|uniref:Autophagy-related protein 2 n=1 Tax=Oedothorax gibbosus TaxID=931172 RepID=A0AAV6UZX8_9ARAC|nr:hypothetical protein JTE90_013785 [Oedothorax gibbosus]
MKFVIDTVVERIFRYLLKKYFGHYLEDLSLDQLSCSLSKGEGSVENVRLNNEALNELSNEYNLPVEFLSASIDCISMKVPLRAMLSESTVFELKGLKLIVQPKERLEDVSMFDSMWGSMTTSLQLAEECLNLKSEEDEDFGGSDRFSKGVEETAKIIDIVFANMKVIFQDISLKIEHVPGNGPSGVALEIKVETAEYFDEAGANACLDDKSGENSSNEPQAYSFKKIVFEGISLFTAQFSAYSRPFSTKCTLSGLEPGSFVPGSPEMPPTHSSLPVKRMETELNDIPVLISKLVGQQELRLKLKQNEAIIGPKLNVEFNLGDLNLFLIPQQVHMLHELLSGLMKPNSKRDDNNKAPFGVTNKPMKPADYALVEQELLRQQQKSRVPSRALKNQQGWSSHSLDESDEEFQLMAMENRPGPDFHQPSNDNDSMCSSISIDAQSDISGNVLGNSRRSSKSRGSTVQAMLQDQLSDLTHFSGSLSSLCIIILHDDSVQESLNRNTSDITKPNSNSTVSLKDRAETFFNDLLSLQMSGLDFKNFASTRGPLSEVCDTNHLRIMASSVSINANEKSSSAQCIINFTLSLYQFEVLECLFTTANFSEKPQTPTYVEVLSCDNQVNVDETDTSLKEACLNLRYQQIEYTTQGRHVKPPANKLEISFGLLTCELDISLTDRIQTLLDFKKFYGQMDTKLEDWKDADVSTSRSSPKTEMKISSPQLVLNLRFPIPDLRSVHDMDRVPWWQQNIHPEVLILEAKDITFNTSLGGDVSQSKYEIQCRDLHGLFKQPDVIQPISFLRVSVDPDIDEISQNDGFDWPRLVIKTITNAHGCDLETRFEEQQEEMFSFSLSEALLSNMDSEPSPFQSTSVAYGSKPKSQNESGEKEDTTNKSINHDEVIKPAQKEVIHNFIEQTVSKSEILLEFSLPTANVVLPSKEFFEMLYNRLGSDLLLWENTILTPKSAYDASGFKVHAPGLDYSTHITDNSGMGKFPVFRPFANDSNSDSDEEDANFCSVYEYCQKDKQRHKRSDVVKNLFTKLSVTIAITKGNLTFHTPALDKAGCVFPEICGKLQLYVEDGLIFLASSYRGDKNESYLCVLADKSTLYHNGTAPKQTEYPVIEILNGHKPQDVSCIIYQSEQGMRIKSTAGEISQVHDMLKIAVHIIRQPKQQLKSFKVAIDISDATLRHYMHIGSQMWINQLIDFLKVQDFPVNGYIPSDVVTEFHLNLSNCAIDYRPLKLPFLSALTVENFNMSCNISATTPSFLFRLISEEMRLFISNTTSAKKVDLKKNYVCVIDSGLIDVTYRTSYDEKNEAKQELEITNNIIHIRTCADSCKALLDVVIYFSSNGDIDQDDLIETEVKVEEKKVTVKNEVSENVHQMMAEAMRDCSKLSISRENDTNAEGLSNPDNVINTDDEFCILEDDPGVGVKPRNGEPEIRMLTDSPIVIVENHFSVSSGKSDALKAPKHFPNAVYTLQLREMSLVWHLYGGNDFKLASDKRKSNRNKEKDTGVTFSDEKKIDIVAGNTAVSFCKVTPMEQNYDCKSIKYTMEHVVVDHVEKPSSDSWLCKGGTHRNHDIIMELQMDKIRFRREVYPLNNEYASWYVLLINDIEIRDRLKSSDINKFLYQYSSQKLPRQTNANMVEVKAIYTRADPSFASEECSLNVSCKPLRLNIDQDSFIFLVGFFNEVMSVTTDEKVQETGENVASKTSPSAEPNQNESNQQRRNSSTTTSETFYKVFTFSPDLLIRIDYQGKHFLMEQGTIKGILLGLAKLNASEIRLKRICYRHGLLGLHKVLAHATNEWQQDILKNQLPSILGGVGPMRSFVTLFNGVKDLFWLPVVQYQKDGQIVRGLQRGTSSFMVSAAVALLDICEGCFGAIRTVAMVGHDMVSTGPSVANRYQVSQETYRASSQPADFREGLTSALNVVRDGFGDTARTIYSVASAEHEHKGMAGAVGGVLRQLPPAVVMPVMVSCDATCKIIETVKHQVLPDSHIEGIHKWKTKNG